MVEQTEHSECGLACATMILNYEGINISLNEIRDTFGVPRGGISLYHLIQVMTAYGIKCKASKNSNCGIEWSCKEHIIKMHRGLTVANPRENMYKWC